MNKTSTVRVAIGPIWSSNSYVTRFAQTISDCGFPVMGFRWTPNVLARADVVILHWPNEFFTCERGKEHVKASCKVASLQAARRLRGLRFVWVAHNAQPHESLSPSPELTRRFIDSLDGVIYLSQSSRIIIRGRYPLPDSLAEHVSAHGHYLKDLVTPPVAPLAVTSGDICLCYFGRIRPYKNVDCLVERVCELDGRGVCLTVAGVRQDKDLSSRIEELAGSARNVRLDLRDSPLPDADLEAAIDDSHAVILPFRDVLNSGSAILALSRNRPVVAPRIGGFPDLQSTVGKDWVYLYDGDLTSTVIMDCVDWLRRRPALPAPDLSAFDWEPIGRGLSEFLLSLKG